VIRCEVVVGLLLSGLGAAQPVFAAEPPPAAPPPAPASAPTAPDAVSPAVPATAEGTPSPPAAGEPAAPGAATDAPDVASPAPRIASDAKEAHAAAPSTQPTTAPYTSAHGLFVQAGFGGGALYGKNDVPEDTRSFSGLALSWHVLIGGTSQRRWAGGAGYSREHIPAPRARDEVIDGDEPDLDPVTFSLDSVVAFVDFYPYQDGFHALGELGFGMFSADRGAGVQVARGPGVVVSLGAGYDFPLTRGLSLGALAQVRYTHQELEEADDPVGLNLFLPSIMLTAAYR
jgi:hypothetical protein